MQIGMMGLGRMGANMVRRLLRDGHECVVYDINSASVAGMVKDGAIGAASLEEFVGKLAKPRSAWLMLPAAITGKIVDQLAALMEPGDIIIDGGNSYYHDAVDQAAKLATKAINFLKSANAGKRDRTADAETSPLENPQYYQFDIDLPAVAEVWRHGSVIGSWLLDLTAGALKNDPTLAQFGGRVSDSGEGRWTLKAAIDTGVPAPVLSSALFDRFASQGEAAFA